MIKNKLFNQKIITIGGKEYKLRPTTVKELFKLRLEGKPGLVFKENGKLYYTELPDERIKFKGDERKKLGHMCSSEYECCRRLSAEQDPNGCAVVRDESFSKYKARPKHREFQCKICLRIEKYDFITCGIETFNMIEDSLKVFDCKNCTRSRVVPSHFDEEEQKKKLVALAQHLNPNISKFSEIANKFK